MKAGAWAVVDVDGINVRTITTTRRGAIINWLVVEQGVPITNTMSHEHIEYLWEEYKGTSVVVNVTVVWEPIDAR